MKCESKTFFCRNNVAINVKGNTDNVLIFIKLEVYPYIQLLSIQDAK